MKKFTLLFFLAITSFTQAKAQWTDFQSPVFGTSVMWSLQVIDANTVWALNYYDGIAVKTTNGGLTWNAYPVTDPGFAGFNTESITAIDANTAWLTASNSAFPPQTKYYKTTNGGINWQLQKTINTNRTFANHFFDANNGVAIGAKYVPVGQSFYEEPEIFTTADGGLNWTASTIANLGQSPQAIYYRSFAVVNNTIWYICYDGEIYKSPDKGQSWTRTNAGFVASSGVITGAIAFTDSNNGLAAKDGVLKRTTDGGATWSTVNATGTFNSFEISAVPGTPSTYISAGRYLNDKGSFISTDHGDTWTTLENSQHHFDVQFINPTTGWSGGIGKMLKFSNSTTGIPEDPVTGSFLIHPNPGKGTVHISSTPGKPFNLEVYELTGKKVRQQAGNSFGSNTLDLSGQKKGIYMLHILTGEKRIVEKIVLQ